MMLVLSVQEGRPECGLTTCRYELGKSFPLGEDLGRVKRSETTTFGVDCMMVEGIDTKGCNLG